VVSGISFPVRLSFLIPEVLVVSFSTSTMTLSHFSLHPSALQSIQRAHIRHCFVPGLSRSKVRSRDSSLLIHPRSDLSESCNDFLKTSSWSSWVRRLLRCLASSPPRFHLLCTIPKDKIYRQRIEGGRSFAPRPSVSSDLISLLKRGEYNHAHTVGGSR
jgi:hypothetical protein